MRSSSNLHLPTRTGIIHEWFSAKSVGGAEKVVKAIDENLKQKGSSADLLSLINKGLSRQESYSLVQKCSMLSWNNNKNFEEIVIKNKKIRKYLSLKDLTEILTKEEVIKNINWIYKNKFK